MAEAQIKFEDGAGYERMMGAWSRLAGNIFLDWLAPRPGLRWLDVGCGNGAFTELLVQRCAPAEVQAIDPSDAQLAYARTRPGAGMATFSKGDAMALPFGEDRFDAATMALVIFFVPDPAKGVAEMVRVVRPGGTIAAYAWDIPGGGLPLEPIQMEIAGMGLKPLRPPSADISRKEALQALWTDAGLQAVQVKEISVQRSFADFEEFWTTSLLSSAVGTTVGAMPAADVEVLKGRVRTRLRAGAGGSITCDARANAIKGRLPA
jgi:ubiquinone/menaquinone biosynthesis C-methylase UbiE